MTIDRGAAAGGPPPPPDITKAASISGQSIPSGLALRRAKMASYHAAPNAPNY
jgi:hypothetical protein